MNIGLAAATFAVVIPAELPDKTFIAAVVLGSRHRAFPVFIGAVTALVLQAGVAVLAGRLVALLPHRAVECIVATALLAGGAYLLLVNERGQLMRGKELADEEHAEAAQTRSRRESTRVALSTFAVIAVAEFGDLTQIAIANLSARYGQPFTVFVGAAAAFAVMSAIAVVIGSTLTRFVPLNVVRRLSGCILGAIGVVSAIDAIRG